MSKKISENNPVIYQILISFKSKLNCTQINNDDYDQIMEALKFIDNLNLFMEDNDIRRFEDKMNEISNILKKRNYSFRDAVLRQINYTEMTIINYRKLDFRNLFFNNHAKLTEEIEREIDQVYKGNKFDFKLFKQMQNIFWVVKNVLEENKKIELENRLKGMKNEREKIKEKRHPYFGRGYQRNDGYMNDYNDYRNYSSYIYNDNFTRNDDSSNSYYNNKGYMSKSYHHGGRGGYMNNQNKKFFKKQEEKEIEIPSDPSYYYKGKEIDLKLDEIGENMINNYNSSFQSQDNSNNYNELENNNNINNINGGNDLGENNNNINEINPNGGNGEEINNIQNNININLNQDSENNGGNGELQNININNNTNMNKDIEIISENSNISPFNKNQKAYTNKMIAVELPANEENNNNLEENSNNGAKIDNTNNINNINNNETNNYYNDSYSSNNSYNYNHNGENNLEYRRYSNDYRDNKYKYNYNNGYKSGNYIKNSYRNNYRYNMRNNISGNNYGDNNGNKRLLFVEIDENNNPVENINENNEKINGQENDINENISQINNNNEPNGEVIHDEIENNNIQNNIDINNEQNIINENKDKNDKIESNELKPENVEKKENQEQKLENNEQKPENNEQKPENNEKKPESKEQKPENNEQKLESNEQNQNKIEQKPENQEPKPEIKEQKQINDINIENNKDDIQISNGENKEIKTERQEDLKEKEKEIQQENEPKKKEDIRTISENITLNPEDEITAKISKSDSNINQINKNELKNLEYNIPEINEENINEFPPENEEISEEDKEMPENIEGQFRAFMIESQGIEPKGSYRLVSNNNNSEENDENENNDLDNNLDENDLDEHINADIENERIMAMNDVEQEKEIKVKECFEKLNIPKIIKDALDELEEEDKKLRLKILNKLDKNYKNEAINPKFTFYRNENFGQNSQIFSNDLMNIINEYNSNPNLSAIPLYNYILSKYNNMSQTKESDIIKEYIFLKTKEIENPDNIWNNMQHFEKKILIPLYQKTIDARNEKYNSLNNIYNLYEQIIKKMFQNSKDLEEVQKFGALSNTFMIDYGEFDIDICIVPKCSITYFRNTYVDKLISGLKNNDLGNFKEIKHTENYRSCIILKGEYSKKNQKVNVNIVINNKIAIFHSILLRLYALYDQRFHIMGIYLKYWAKINGLHGANFLPSYALLFMIIHFLQKVVEPKVLPNLQKIPIFDNDNSISEPKYGEKIYEYSHEYEIKRTNIHFENNTKRIKEYMSAINNNKINEETVTNLLVKFFEYYSYCYDSNQKISIHKDLIESLKKGDDNITFSIEDPFDIMSNPGKSLEKDSEYSKKFIQAMKKEVNLILSGEYVKRLEYEKERLIRNNKK